MKQKKKVKFSKSKVSISTLMLEPLPKVNEDEIPVKKVYSQKHNGNLKVLPFHKSISRLI